MTSSIGQHRHHRHHRHRRQHRRTDFGQYQHMQLIKMLYDSDPDAVAATADAWAAVGRSMHDRALDLQQQLEGFEAMWSGGAAEQFEIMIKDLASGITQVADNALQIRDITASAGEALQSARERMPAPVAVPDLSPVTRAMAATPPTVDGMNAAEANETLTLYAQARASADQAAQAQAASNAAQSQAVAIMHELATTYNNLEDTIPDTPTTGSMPVNPDGAPVSPDDPNIAPIDGVGIVPRIGPGDPGLDPDGTAPRPGLFNNVFTAGLAAASAALGGRFAPAVSDLIRRNTPGPEVVPTGAGADGAKPPAIGGGGGGGGAHIGGAGGGGGASVHAPAPTASGTLSGAGGGSMSGLGAAAGVAAAAKVGTMGGGFMGGMPMGMMGMGDGGMGGARRIPPWLIETEDVWGESSVVAPSVIGEDGDAAPANPAW